VKATAEAEKMREGKTTKQKYLGNKQADRTQTLFNSILFSTEKCAAVITVITLWNIMQEKQPRTILATP